MAARSSSTGLGTTLRYKPGITGWFRPRTTAAPATIGYYLQPLLLLAPFAKHLLSVTLRGITNGPDFQRRRSPHRHAPAAGPLRHRVRRPPCGEPRCRPTAAVRWLSCRPCASCRRSTCSMRAKCAACVASGLRPRCRRRSPIGWSTARRVANFLPDVWVYTTCTAARPGRVARFGVAFVAETTTGALLAAESSGQAGVLPEDGRHRRRRPARRDQGVRHRRDAPAAGAAMTLGAEDVPCVRLGSELDASIGVLRLLRDFLGVSFQTRRIRTVALLACRASASRT